MKIISWNMLVYIIFLLKSQRIDMIISTILSFEADIICLQEVLTIKYLK